MDNRKKSHLLSIVLILSIITGLLTACGAQQGTTSSEKNRNTNVRVGFFPNITHSQALIGKADGSFQKALGDSHQIEWKQFNAGPAEIEALFAGELDIAYIGPGPAIIGFTKSKGDIQIIAGATNAGAILVSRRDLPIKDVKELSGKKVAVPQFGNTQDLSLRNLLQTNDLKDTTKGGTVEVHQVNNPDIKTLLDKGEIDAALVPEPWGSILVQDIQANIVLDYDQVWREGNYSTAVVVVRTEFLKDHPDIVENFLKNHVDLTDYINKNKEEAKQTANVQISELTKKPLSPEILDAAYDRLTITSNPEKDSILDFVTLSVNTGFIKVQPDTTNLVNLDLLNKVLREKGKAEIQ